MRANCEIKTCSFPGITTKVCEDFEAVTHNVCWSCGDKIKEKLTDEQLKAFLFTIQVIEEGLE